MPDMATQQMIEQAKQLEEKLEDIRKDLSELQVKYPEASEDIQNIIDRVDQNGGQS